jgi:hypothetical protein
VNFKYAGEVIVIFGIAFSVVRWVFRNAFDNLREPPPGPPLDLSGYRIQRKSPTPKPGDPPGDPPRDDGSETPARWG